MYKILLSVFLIAGVACKQKPPVSEKIKTNIQNSKTDKHVNIPGTRLYIVPPTGFSVSSTPAGLQKGDSSMITIADLTTGNFYSNTASFNKKGFEQKGIKIFDYQDIKVNGFPAKYVSLQGDANAKMYWLVFGDSSFSTMLMGVYPAADQTTGNQIVSALNTIHYDKTKKVDPFEAAAFSLDDKQSKFKFFQFNANMYVYTIDGVNNKDNPDAPFIVVTQMPKDRNTTTKEVARMILDKMQGYGLTNAEVKNATQEKIDGYDAYEAEVHGQMEGKASIIFQFVIAKGDKVISMQGVTKTDLEENLQAFRSLSRTIRFK